jgi:hypothetical protein
VDAVNADLSRVEGSIGLCSEGNGVSSELVAVVDVWNGKMRETWMVWALLLAVVPGERCYSIYYQS